MSYLQNEWNDGDAVTSAKLNNLESGVTAVGYEPTTWAAGDVVTAEKLNHLEQGVADSVTLEDYFGRGLEEFTITSEMLSYGSIGYNLSFNLWTKLKKINGLDNITGEIRPSTFYNTSALEELNAPNATNIGFPVANSNNDSCFAGSGIKKLSLGSAKYMGNGSISGVYNLEYLYLPSAVTMTKSVQGCPKLKHVYIGKDCTSIDSSCFGGSGGQSTGMIIDCGFAEGAVSGAPWGATNATINYSVPDPGSIEAMIEGE